MEDRTFSESLRVDRNAKVIHGVKILGRESRNGYEYSPSALREAASHYEGITVNVNHPPRSTPNLERGFTEGIGVLHGVTVKDDGVFGDLHYFESNAATPLMLERAEKHPRTFGLSHNADGHKKTIRGRTVVESVTNVRSVDLVGKPATTQGIFESEDLETEPVKITIKKLLESVSKKTKGHKTLLEMVEADPAMAEMPVEMPMDEETEAPTESPEDQIKAGILAAIVSKLESASPEELQGVLEALGMGDSLSGAASGNGGGGPSGGESAAETTTESVRGNAAMNAQIKALMESVRKLETERDAAEAKSAAMALLDSMGREATDVRIKALTLLESDAERKQLVESWPKRSGGFAGVGGVRPQRTVPLTESEQPSEYKPLAGKEWAAAVR